jgi:hypothetical protein
METSIPLHVPTADVEDLRELVGHAGPFATVYVDTDADVDDAPHRSGLHWRALRDELRRDGAPDAVLEAIDPLVPDAHLAGGALAVVAGTAGVLHTEHFAGVPARELARWAPLPALLPLIAHRQAAVPYVLVLADRTGADLTAERAGGRGAEHEAAGGERGPISRSGPGGWSQHRYQQRAENTWEHNARDVARDVEQLVDEVGAVVVAVGGDVRAIELLRRDLPERLQHLVVTIDATRAADGGPGAARALPPVIAHASALQTAQALQRLAAHPELTADGAAATVAALQEARVGVLVVQAHEDDERDAWFGRAPTAIGMTAEEAGAAAGGGEVTCGRLVDAVVRAALGTGAGIRVVPGNPPGDGLSALLRWPEQAPPPG